MRLEVVALGDAVASVVDRTGIRGRSDLDPWRDICGVYLQAAIFMPENAANKAPRAAVDARQKFQKFINELESHGLRRRLRYPKSRQALEHFLKINMRILSNVYFQELNLSAVTKILKSTMTWHRFCANSLMLIHVPRIRQTNRSPGPASLLQPIRWRGTFRSRIHQGYLFPSVGGTTLFGPTSG